ncbi:MAG TPA: hypothetical protein VII61_12375, partial [Ktedonobacteraceae bacterium]
MVTIDQPATQERTAWMSHSATSNKEQTLIITEDRRDETADYKIEDEETNEHRAIGEENEDDEDDEDEEKRRRNALIGFSLPLLGGALEGQGTMNVPMAQGTPQISGAPTIAGTPPLAHALPPMGTPPLAHGMPPIGGITTTPLVLPGPASGSAYPPP